MSSKGYNIIISAYAEAKHNHRFGEPAQALPVAALIFGLNMVGNMVVETVRSDRLTVVEKDVTIMKEVVFNSRVSIDVIVTLSVLISWVINTICMLVKLLGVVSGAC